MSLRSMQIAIRADSSARMGSGHLVRCLTLAEELRGRGASIRFISRELSGNFIGRVEAEGHPVLRLPAPPGWSDPGGEDYAAWLGVSQQEDARECLQSLDGAPLDWLIVDHYSLDHEWESRLRTVARRIAVIDDLANRRHDCDIIFDQNYFGAATATRYDALVPPACRRLLGPQFALLQPLYRLLRPLIPARNGFVTRVLVFFGGSDLPNDTMRALQALSAPEFAQLAVDVVAGQNHPDRSGLEAWVNRRPGAALYSGLPSLAGLTGRADLAVGGGGSTTWERACLALPAIVVTLADNQRAFSAALAADGYQVLLGRNSAVSVDMWRAALREVIASPARLAELSRRVATLTDGSGSESFAKIILSGHAWSVHSVPVSTDEHSGARLLKVNVLSDRDSWLNQYICEFVARLTAAGHDTTWAHDPKDLGTADVCFILGCSQMLRPEDLAKSPYNLVVHESALPQGRGWSPMTWQVLEDKRSITVTLFEAAAAVDSGPIHLQTTIELTGCELVEEWRGLQAQATLNLCRNWIRGYPDVARGAHAQSGAPSYYRRRGPADSRLDPECSIASQFDLLRVVDNTRYPAHFEYRGRMYKLLVEADPAGSVGDSATEGS